MSFHHYSVLMQQECCHLYHHGQQQYCEYVDLECIILLYLWSKDKYRFIVSQILIQDTVLKTYLKMYLNTRYKYVFRVLDTYLDTCI